MDTSKKEFRQYLETTGVVDMLTKVMVGLYEEPEKPEDALKFIRKHLGSAPSSSDAATLAEEVDRLKKANEELQAENAALKKQLAEQGAGEEQAAA
eukprot:m.48953 g.48953  ORF g.48953 m.48953 type:complete len:96 (+) comp12035_c0_seq1:306-593(+)